MKTTVSDNLLNILEDYNREKKDMQAKVNENLAKISEIDAFLQTILEREETDFKVFSPRTAEKIYEEQLTRNRKEKKRLEEENEVYYRKINKLSNRIDSIQSAVNEMNEAGDYDNGVNQKIFDIQEKERQRIARDLHDTSLQNLTHLIHKLELSTLYLDKDPVRAKLEMVEINRELKDVIEEIRNTIFNLRPMSLDDLGFKEAISRLFSRINENSFIKIDGEIEEIKSEINSFQLTIFRIVQECVYNAVKHSGGDRIAVTVKREGNSCIIEVKDNGHGFDPSQIDSMKGKHFGLSIVRERVELLSGKIEFISGTGVGTTVSIIIPL